MSDKNNKKEQKDIFERERTGEVIRVDDPDYPKIIAVIDRAFKLTSQLNNLRSTSKNEIRELFSKLIDKEVDESVVVWPPFYTDFGVNITLGKNVFINHACTFMDRGGIFLEDHVLIGPRVNLITINHSLEASERRNTISKPITVRKNAWIGAAATVNPGITIGENSVVAAGAVVTKEVLPNTLVAGVPARVVKQL